MLESKRSHYDRREEFRWIVRLRICKLSRSERLPRKLLKKRKKNFLQWKYFVFLSRKEKCRIVFVRDYKRSRVSPVSGYNVRSSRALGDQIEIIINHSQVNQYKWLRQTTQKIKLCFFSRSQCWEERKNVADDLAWRRKQQSQGKYWFNLISCRRSIFDDVKEKVEELEWLDCRRAHRLKVLLLRRNDKVSSEFHVSSTGSFENENASKN